MPSGSGGATGGSYRPAQCADANAMCQAWAAVGECQGVQAGWMLETCPSACGLCRGGRRQAVRGLRLAVDGSLVDSRGNPAPTPEQVQQVQPRITDRPWRLRPCGHARSHAGERRSQCARSLARVSWRRSPRSFGRASPAASIPAARRSCVRACVRACSRARVRGTGECADPRFKHDLSFTAVHTLRAVTFIVARRFRARQSAPATATELSTVTAASTV